MILVDQIHYTSIETTIPVKPRRIEVGISFTSPTYTAAPVVDVGM